MKKAIWVQFLKRSRKTSPYVQVHKGIILFPALHLLVVELMGENEMGSFLNEHITALHILLYQDFVFSGDYEKSQIEPSCRCA